MALISDASDDIAKHVTELLVKDGMDQLTKDEFLLWVANHIIRSSRINIKLPTTKAYDEFLTSLEARHGVTLMKPDRYYTALMGMKLIHPLLSLIPSSLIWDCWVVLDRWPSANSDLIFHEFEDPHNDICLHLCLQSPDGHALK